MHESLVRSVLVLASLLLSGDVVRAQPAQVAVPDLTREPTLYVVAYSHLDTQWRWDYVKTINEYIPNTMRANFAMFEKYPHYVLNFPGSNRYQMMKDYYPADYEKVKKYVAAGRWFPAGSSVEEGDVSLVSPEAMMRQILYGNRFFEREFRKTSAEYMLPDCFGFPATLPSLLAHMGIRGFSTQKLTWLGSAPAGGPGSPQRTPEGIPFNVGVWEGLDGRGVIAALNADKYTGVVAHDLTRAPSPDLLGPNPSKRAQDVVQNWPDRIDRNGRVSGLFTDYHYYGAGDIGGAPLEASLRMMEAIVTRGSTVPPALEWITARYPELPEPLPQREPVKMGDGPVRIVAGTAEQMFLDIQPGQTSKLPRYQGDLLLTKHSTGVLTSQAYMKRWNRQNELLADGAERASVGAEWLGGRPYPRDRLLRAWQLVLAGQFHDILPGTSLPKAYEYSWNDEVLAMNQFAGILTSASEAIASRLDTQAEGTAVVVYNPLDIEREDVVEAKVSFPGGEPKAVVVVGPDGKEAPAQLAEGGKVLFLAKVPSVGYAVYDVRPAGAPAPSTLAITDSTLENHRYRIEIDGNGDVSSIFDKTLEKEILSAPHRLAFQSQMPKSTPAWDFDWKDQKLPPRGFVVGPARVRILENGPVRVTLEIARESEGSRFVQAVRLAAGDPGNRVELANVIDWKSNGAALKATFAFDATHPEATYSWGIGSVRRGNNNERMYEVPTQQWFDLTDTSGAHGVTVLSDCKYGVDKPSDNTLRLTLLYSPAIDPESNSRFYPDQATQDWGHHEFVYGLASHDGNRRRAQTDGHALRLNQPLVAFESRSHAGPLGRRFSLLRVSDSRVRVLALKKAEESDEIVVRLVELDGRSAPGVRVSFPSAVTAAREINGAEAPLGRAQVVKGDLTVDLPPSGMRSFALKLAPPRAKVAAPRSTPVALPYDLAVATLDGARSAGGFDASGNALAAEMVPAEIEYAGIRFDLAPATSGKPNALVARGQALPLPAGKFNRAYVLAAAMGGDQPATFRAGANSVHVTIQDWTGYVGQWDNRKWSGELEQGPPGYDLPGAPPPRFPEYLGLEPGFIKPAPVAWFASHRHTAAGANQPYAYTYLFATSIDLPAGEKTLTLPDNERIRVLAVSVAEEGEKLRPARPLFDTLERTP